MKEATKVKPSISRSTYYARKFIIDFSMMKQNFAPTNISRYTVGSYCIALSLKDILLGIIGIFTAVALTVTLFSGCSNVLELYRNRILGPSIVSIVERSSILPPYLGESTIGGFTVTVMV